MSDGSDRDGPGAPGDEPGHDVDPDDDRETGPDEPGHDVDPDDDREHERNELVHDLDPVTLEVVRNRLEGIAEEMGEVLVRSAYSPNITERRDCSTAIFDADGRLVAQAEHIPVHLGAMPAAVAAVRDRGPVPGDVFVCNDPYAGGTHLPDVTMVSPLAPRGEIVGYAASRAHHADVGGSTPGSMPAGARELYQEGLRLPPVRLVRGDGYETGGEGHETGGDHGTSDDHETGGESVRGDRVRGERNDALFETILANVRDPEERRADFSAQLAANGRAETRLAELFDEHGRERVLSGFAAVQAYARERVEHELDALPDGTYHATDWLEGDGISDEELAIEVAVTIDGAELAVDFAGTASQVTGNLNAPPAVATSAVYFVVRCLTDPEIPANAGCYDPVSVTIPDGSLLNPDPPAAVVGGNVETSQRVADVTLAALAEAAPDRVPAQGQGTMNNLTIGSRDDDFSYYETIGGGAGARPDAEGLDGVHVGMTNTLNTPIEALEAAYPLRVERYALRPDSGGDGRYRGGMGLERRVRVETDATVSLLSERRRHRPQGVAGGEPGAAGENRIDGEPVGSKVTRDVDAGTTVTVRTPGGGGHGEPADEDGDEDGHVKGGERPPDDAEVEDGPDRGEDDT